MAKGGGDIAGAARAVEDMLVKKRKQGAVGVLKRPKRGQDIAGAGNQEGSGKAIDGNAGVGYALRRGAAGEHNKLGGGTNGVEVFQTEQTSLVGGSIWAESDLGGLCAAALADDVRRDVKDARGLT